MSNPFDQFDAATPQGDSNPFDQFDAGKKKDSRSAVGEIANQFKAGILVDLPKMAGQALKYTSDPGNKVYEAGQGITDWADEQGKRPDLAPQEDQHNIVTNALASGARMIPQSVAPAAAVGAGILALPASIPATVGLGAASVLGAVPAAMSQGQETLEKAREKGIPEDQALAAARSNALIEGGGEALGTYAGGKLLGIAGKTAGKMFGRTAGDALADQTSTAITKPFLKQLGETALVETGTEIGQNAGEAAVENAYGIDSKTPYQAGKEAIAPTLGMTALLAPFGLAGFAHAGKQRGERTNALASAETTPEDRQKIAGEFAAEISKVDKNAAANFMANAQSAIDGKQALSIGESMFLPPVAAEETPAPLSLPAPTYTGTPSDQVMAAEVERQNQADAAQKSADALYAERSAFEQANAGIAATPAIPVVGPLSAAANLAVQSGAHEQTQMQQAMQDAVAKQNPAKKGESDVAGTQSTQQGTSAVVSDGNRTMGGNHNQVDSGVGQGGSAQVAAADAVYQRPIDDAAPIEQVAQKSAQANATKAGATAAQDTSQGQGIDLSNRTHAQLNYLTQHGKPGYKEAAVAELQRRGVQVSTPEKAKSDTLSAEKPANSATVPAQKAEDSAKTPAAPVEVNVEVRQNQKAKGEKLIFINGEQVGVVSRARSPGTSDWGFRGSLSGELHFTEEKAVAAETEAAKKHYSNRIKVAAMEAEMPPAAETKPKPENKKPTEPPTFWTSSTPAHRKWIMDASGLKQYNATTPWNRIKPEHQAQLIEQWGDKPANQDTIKNEKPAAATVSKTESVSEQAPIKKDVAVDAGSDPDLNIEKRILFAADSIDKLRKVDVERVLAQGNIDRQKMAEYIKRKRPDLSGEVDDVMAELQPSVSQPKTDAAHEAKQDKAPASKPKPARNKIDPEKDSMFAAIAKAGGMDTDELLSNGIDSNDITYETSAKVKKDGQLGKKRRMPISFGFALPLHKKGGMSFDGMREAMQQYGYLPQDATKNDAIDLFKQELAGDPVYTAQAIEFRRDQDQEEFDKQMAKEQDRIDAELAAQEIAEDDAGFNELSLDEQSLASDFAEFAFGENGKQDDNATRAGMRALGFTEEEINDELAKNSRAQRESEEIAAGSGQEGGAGRDGNRAEDAQVRELGGQEGFDLAGQTNSQAAEEFAQQQTGENGAPTKAQADKERDAVPFSLGMQSQPKPQGVQTGLFTADGRVSVEAKPADTADAKIDKSDDWLAELFGDPQSAEDKAINESQLAQQAQDKADRVDAAIAMLTGEIEANDAAAAELAARKYKTNRKQIELHGDGPGRNASMSISAINESRRRRMLEAMQNASASIKRAISFISENPDAAFKQVTDMVDVVTKQFNEGFFGRSAKLDAQLDMAVGSMIGAGSYSGEGSAGRKLRMAAYAYLADQAHPQQTARGEVGASLSKEQRKEVLKTLVDVYKANNAPKEFKGVDRNGNERSGYAHSPEFFVKSDITGAMVRYYVTLPDGRIAHPTELFSDYTQSDIDAALQKQISDEKNKKDFDAMRLESLNRRSAPSLNEANRLFWKANPGLSERVGDDFIPAILTDGSSFIRTRPDMVDDDLRLLGDGWTRQLTLPERIAINKQKKADENAARAAKLAELMAKREAGERYGFGDGLVETEDQAKSAADRLIKDEKAKVETAAVDSETKPKTERLSGNRRDPTKVNVFNPYVDGDVVTIDGKEWQIKNDGGWYLTTTGNWRGEHPTIKKIAAMTDLIRAIEQEAVAKEEVAPAWHTKLPTKGLPITDDQRKPSGYGRVPNALADEAYAAITQNQLMNGMPMYAYYMPAANGLNGIVRLIPDDQNAAKPWVLLNGEAIRPAGQTKEQVVAKLTGWLRSAPVLGDDSFKPVEQSNPEPKKGDRFTDGEGNTWEIWNARSSLIEAHPVVDGKPVVNRDSGQRFATDDRAKSANPEARTDYNPIADSKTKEEPKPAEDGKPDNKAAKRNVGPKMAGDSGLGKATITPAKSLPFITDILSKENARQVTVKGGNADVLNQVANLFGKKIIFFRTVDAGRSENADVGAQAGRTGPDAGADGQGNRLPGSDFVTNGFVNSGRPDLVFLNVDSSNHLLYIVGHEVGHTLRMDDPALWSSMAKQLQPLIRRWSEYKANMGQKLDSDAAYAEELFGDIIGQNFLNQAFWNDLAKENQSLFKRIAQAAIKVLNKAMSLIVGQDVSIYVSDMEQARAIIAKTMAQYAEGSAKGIYAKYASQYDGEYVNKRMVAWHGSPHDHDKFDSSKIGTGEGAQAYGYGHYFAGAKDVAEWYRRKLSGADNSSITFNGKQYGDSDAANRKLTNDVKKWAEETGRDPERIDVALEYLAGMAGDLGSARQLAAKEGLGISHWIYGTLNDLSEHLYPSPNGRLYQVELAPTADEYLDWDKPLSEQSEKVQKALGIDPADAKRYAELSERLNELSWKEGGLDSKEWNKLVAEARAIRTKSPLDLTGGDFYAKTKNDLADKAAEGTSKAYYKNERWAKEASDYLHSIGIRGIRYLDGSSRGAGDGSRNYVIFNDADVSITAKYNVASQGKISPADKAIYGMAAEGKSAEDILKFIGSASRNPFYRQLAKLLMKTGISPTITVGDGKGWKMNAGEGNKYAAGYNPTTNTISLFRPASAERNMLHELMHAATLKALSGKGMASAQMKALYNHVKKTGKLNGMYGMSDVYEFIAEAFSNPKFQEQLKKVAAPTATGGKMSSAWDWFVRVVRGILGIPQGQENALSQALEIGVEVMREDMALRKSEGGASAYTERMAKDNLDPDDAEAMRVQKAIEGKSTIDVAQWISVSGSPSERMIAGKVLSRLKMLESAGVNLKFKVAHVGDSIPRSLLGARGITTYKFGKADPSVDVWINGADVTGKVGTSVRTVLHELVHAATMGAVRLGGLKVAAGSKLAADVADLYAVTNSIIGHFNRRVADSKAGKITLTDFEQQMFNSENNAFRDVHETLAWALTDVDAQSYLESIPYQSKSAWTSFVSAIRQFLGLSSSADTALSEVLRVSEAIMSDNINDMIAMSNITGTAMATQESSDQMILSDHHGSDAIRYATGPKQTDSAAFRKWFGDSKVVDANGKPMVVYHGTDSDFNVFSDSKPNFFSASKLYSTAYGKKTVPVYLSIEMPFDPANDGKARDIFNNEFRNDPLGRGAPVLKDGQSVPFQWADELFGFLYEREHIRENVEFDGIVVDEGHITGTYGEEGRKSWVPLDNYQIKSAIGNNGDFDPNNQDIRYNVSDDHWGVAEPSKMDDVIYALQDKHIDTKRVMQAIMGAGKKIKDSFNPYLQEELFHGRSAKGVKDFLDFELRPLLKQMQDAKVDMGDFEEYLWNRHAEERNQQIAKINPDMQDGGSGIETATARAYLAGLGAEQRRTFESLAAKVEAMNKASQRVLVESGLEKQSTIDAWNGAYKHYVPLQREDVDNGHVGTGKGFSVRGSATKRAMGSGKNVVDIIANLTMQRERNIVRAEKNRVSNALMGLAVENPNKDFWTVDAAPKERVVEETAIYTVVDEGGAKLGEFTRMSEAEKLANKTPGSTIDQKWGDRVTERVVPGFKNRDNVLLTRVNGDDHYIIFNERDERAMRMATAMKNMDVDNLGRVLSLVGRATRYLSAINTQYNPVFGVINLIRDAQGALLNLSSTPLAGEQKRVMAYTKDALVGIYKDIRAHRAGLKPSSNWASLFEEFQREGGATGYRDQYANAEARAEAIKAELEQFKEGKAKQLTRGLFGWLSDYNETMENAVRLASYKAAIEKGMSKAQAASLAKNITVNFNRKGQMATQVGSLYAFFNASVQGTARIAGTLFDMKDGDIKTARLSKTGKKIVYGGIMLGSMQALLLAAAGFGDDEPPDFIKERNLILPIGDGKYLTLAMPLGYHVFPGIGRLATEFVLSGGKDPLKKIAAFGSMFAEALNPIGNSGFSLQTITPSVIDPLAALAENRDFTGKEIYQNDFNKLNPTPGFTRAKDTATAWSKAIAEGLNFITGGTDYKPGLFTPTPDQIDYLIGQVTGGVGREVGKVSQVVSATTTGEDLPIYKVPLVGRFVGDTQGKSGESAKFYNSLREINMHEAEYKGLIGDGKRQEAAEYLAENPAVKLIMLGNQSERAVKKLKEAKRNLIENDAPQEKVAAMEDQIAKSMKLFNDRVTKALAQ